MCKIVVKRKIVIQMPHVVLMKKMEYTYACVKLATLEMDLFADHYLMVNSDILQQGRNDILTSSIDFVDLDTLSDDIDHTAQIQSIRAVKSVWS